MEREIDLKEISDGKLYEANDMVKAGLDRGYRWRFTYRCCKGYVDQI